MSKRLSSRNPKSRGLKAKYAIQICLLLGVCCWLIYQIKHSHAKKKEFDENVMKEKLSRDEDMFLGRKGLIRSVPKIDSHVEEEELDDDGSDATEREDIQMEQDKEEAEMRHREEANGRQERVDREDDETEHEDKVEEEVEQDEKEDDNTEKGTAQEKDNADEGAKQDEEIHESDDGDGGNDHDEEAKAFKEEDKDDADGDEDIVETDLPVEDHEQEEDGEKDLDGGEEDSHEAREENYKADDASSAVDQVTLTMGTGSENVSRETLSGNDDKEETQLEHNSTDRNLQVLNSGDNTDSISADQKATSMMNSNGIDLESNVNGTDVSDTSQPLDVTNSSYALGDAGKVDTVQLESQTNESTAETKQLDLGSNSTDSDATKNSTSTESDGAEGNSGVEESLDSSSEEEASHNNDDLSDSSITQIDLESKVELSTLPDIISNGVNDRNGAAE